MKSHRDETLTLEMHREGKYAYVLCCELCIFYIFLLLNQSDGARQSEQLGKFPLCDVPKGTVLPGCLAFVPFQTWKVPKIKKTGQLWQNDKNECLAGGCKHRAKYAVQDDKNNSTKLRCTATSGRGELSVMSGL